VPTYTVNMKKRVTRGTWRRWWRRCIKHKPETDNNYLLQWKQELKRNRRTVLPIWYIIYKYIFTYNKGSFIFSPFLSSWTYIMRVKYTRISSGQPCGSTAFLNCLKTIFYYFYGNSLSRNLIMCVYWKQFLYIGS